jgi:hypothetical protein
MLNRQPIGECLIDAPAEIEIAPRFASGMSGDATTRALGHTKVLLQREMA